MALGPGTNPVSWVASADIARVAAAQATRPGEAWSADLGRPEALTLPQVDDLVAASPDTRIPGETKIPLGMLRAMSTLVTPFNSVWSGSRGWR